MSLTIQSLVEAQCPQALANVLCKSFNTQEQQIQEQNEKIKDLSDQMLNQTAEMKYLKDENYLSDRLISTDSKLKK